MSMSRTVRISPLLGAVVLFMGCAPMERPEQPPSSSAPVTYGDGPVTLLFKGSDGGNCEWQLFAVYPRDTPPHAVDMRATYTDLRSGGELTMSGTAEYLPNTDHVANTSPGQMVESELYSWSESLPCSQVQANITIKECLEGPCPDYIAGESRIPIDLILTVP